MFAGSLNNFLIVLEQSGKCSRMPSPIDKNVEEAAFMEGLSLPYGESIHSSEEYNARRYSIFT